MKWKLKPKQLLRFHTGMDEIDTLNHKDFSMNGLVKMLDKDIDSADFQKVFKSINEVANNVSYVTFLKEQKKNVIDIETFVKVDSVKKDTSKMGKVMEDMRGMMSKMSDNPTLRGSIHEDGTINSFYTKNDQKNLLALFFQLPGKQVKLGDSWQLDVHFISMDQNFICDSSFKKNEVKVIKIDNRNNDHVLVLQYDITEFVTGDFNSPFNNERIKTSMKMTYKGIADFSIEKGTWLNYNGILSLLSTGAMVVQTTKKL